MANELESLLVSLEADTRDFRRKMDGAAKSVGRFENTTNRKLKQSTAHFQKFTARVDKSMAGLAATLASILTINFADGLARANNSMADLADTVGFSTRRFQELHTLMLDQGMSTTQAESAFRRFAIAVGELREGQGALFKSLERLRPETLRAIQNTRNQDEALRVLADTMGRISDPAERASLANRAFGRSGIQLAAILSQGTDVLDRAAKVADEYSTVVSDRAITATRAYQREVDLLNRSWNAFATEALSNALPAIKELSAGLRGIAAASARRSMQPYLWFDKVPENAETAAEAIRVAKERVDELKKALTHAPDAGIFDRIATLFSRGNTEDAIASLTQRIKELKRISDEMDAAKSMRGTTSPHTVKRPTAPSNKKVKIDPFVTTVDNLGAEMAKARSIVNDHLKQMEAETGATVRSITWTIESGISAPLEDAFSGNLRSAKEYFRELVGGLGNAVAQALVLRPLMEGINKQMTSFATPDLNGNSGLNSLFGSLFGRAGGGNMSPSTPYVVGERGPEVVVPKTAASVIPSHMVKSGGGQTVYQIDARGADAGVEQRIYAALAEIERRRPSAPQQVAAASRRFPTRRA